MIPRAKIRTTVEMEPLGYKRLRLIADRLNLSLGAAIEYLLEKHDERAPGGASRKEGPHGRKAR